MLPPTTKNTHRADYSFKTQKKSRVIRVWKSGVRKSQVTKWRHPYFFCLIILFFFSSFFWIKADTKEKKKKNIHWYFLALLLPPPFFFFFFFFFVAYFGYPLPRSGIPKWFFLWHKSKACQDLKDHQTLAAQVIALRRYHSVPKICILRNGFSFGEGNSIMDFPFAWMLN